MSRPFKSADYEATLEQTVKLGDCLLPDHLARFIADVITHRQVQDRSRDSATQRIASRAQFG